MAEFRWRRRGKKKKKKNNEDLNNMSLAEDPEYLRKLLPSFFCASFEKKMKDHLESLKCLGQSLAQKSGYRNDQFFEGAAPSIRLGVVSATTEQEANRVFTLTPTEEVEERHRAHSKGRDSQLNRNSPHRDNLRMYGKHYLWCIFCPN